MNVDTRLSEAAEAVRESRREADMAVVPPTRRSGARGLLLAGVVAVAALLLIGTPALLQMGGDEPLAQPADVGADAPVSTESEATDPSSGLVELPILLLESPGWQLTGATDVVNPETGTVIAREIIYENESGAVWLTVHKSSFEGTRAAETLSSAQSSESIQIDGRDVTLHVLDHDQLDGPGLDTHALQWADGEFGVIVIGWGLDRSTTLALYESIVDTDQAEWDGIQSSIAGVTPTTIAPTEDGS